MICNSTLFDIAMFKAVWRPVISAIAYAFISFEDEFIIQRAIASFSLDTSDSSGDEVVLLKIITVILDCFSDSIGFGLGDTRCWKRS